MFGGNFGAGNTTNVTNLGTFTGLYNLLIRGYDVLNQYFFFSLLHDTSPGGKGYYMDMDFHNAAGGLYGTLYDIRVRSWGGSSDTTKGKGILALFCQTVGIGGTDSDTFTPSSGYFHCNLPSKFDQPMNVPQITGGVNIDNATITQTCRVSGTTNAFRSSNIGYGALIVDSGGAYIEKDVYIHGNTKIDGIMNVPQITGGVNIDNTTISQTCRVSGTTNASRVSNIGYGALIVDSGGAYIEKDVYIHGNTKIDGIMNVPQITGGVNIDNTTISQTCRVSGTTNASRVSNIGIGTLIVDSGGAYIEKDLYIHGNMTIDGTMTYSSVNSTNILISGSSNATSSTTGALQVPNGGVSIGKDLIVAGTITNNVQVITSSNNTTSSTTGALIVQNGGVYIGKDAIVVGNIYTTTQPAKTNDQSVATTAFVNNWFGLNTTSLSFQHTFFLSGATGYNYGSYQFVLPYNAVYRFQAQLFPASGYDPYNWYYYGAWLSYGASSETYGTHLWGSTPPAINVIPSDPDLIHNVQTNVLSDYATSFLGAYADLVYPVWILPQGSGPPSSGGKNSAVDIDCIFNLNSATTTTVYLNLYCNSHPVNIILTKASFTRLS